MNAEAELDASLRRQSGVALDHAVLHLDGAAHSVDDAAKSMMLPSPVRLTMRPWWAAMAGSIRSLRRPRRRARVRSSSAPASRLEPTTSTTKIAASFRVSVIGPSGHLAI